MRRRLVAIRCITQERVWDRGESGEDDGRPPRLLLSASVWAGMSEVLLRRRSSSYALGPVHRNDQAESTEDDSLEDSKNLKSFIQFEIGLFGGQSRQTKRATI